MRRSILGVFLLLACSGQNTVAGEEKTKGEQLESSLPAWCSSICQRLSACESQNDCVCDGDTCDCGTSVGSDCPEECQEELSRWATSDECAAIGERYKKCIDDKVCDAVGTRCTIIDEEEDLCPDNGGIDPGNDGLDGGSSGPPEQVDVPSSAGGGSAGGGGPLVGPGVPVVHCLGSEGEDGPSPPSEGPHIICEESWGACSDGQDRRVICATGSEDRSFCSCFLDTEVTGAFDPGGICPTLQQVNAGCAWSLQ